MRWWGKRVGRRSGRSGLCGLQYVQTRPNASKARVSVVFIPMQCLILLHILQGWQCIMQTGDQSSWAMSFFRNTGEAGWIPATKRGANCANSEVYFRWRRSSPETKRRRGFSRISNAPALTFSRDAFRRAGCVCKAQTRPICDV